MLCRLALALVCGLALAAPSLADDNPPPSGCAGLPNCTTTGGHVPPPTTSHFPARQQADWKLLAGYSTWEPERRNRIFYARVSAQTTAWKLHLYETAATRKALHQNFSRYGLLAIFLTDRQVAFTIDGVYLAGDGALSVQVGAVPPPPPPVCPPPGPPDAPTPACFSANPLPSSEQYRLIAIRKDSLPAPVKRLYITEAP